MIALLRPQYCHMTTNTDLPILLSISDAVDFIACSPELTDAQRAYTAAFMSNEGATNAEIRDALVIKHNYQASHLIRVGKVHSTDHLRLWCENPDRIKLGHMRALTGCTVDVRDHWLRKLLTTKITVQSLEALARGDEQQQDVDVRNYETYISENLGRPINLSFNKRANKGSLTLTYYGLDDLDEILKSLGLIQDEESF